MPIRDFSVVVHADFAPRGLADKYLYIEEKNLTSQFDALMLGPTGVYTDSSKLFVGINRTLQSYDLHSLGWTMSGN